MSWRSRAQPPSSGESRNGRAHRTRRTGRAGAGGNDQEPGPGPAGPVLRDRAAGQVPQRAQPGPQLRGAVLRQRPVQDRPARTGGVLPAAAGDHRGQPDGEHRHRDLLPGDQPASIQDSMEKQMRADRDKRAMILQAEGQRESAIKSAEGQKQAAILSAEGQKTAAILTAEADRQSRILRAEGERAARYLAAQGQAKAIETVFQSIHDADPDPKLLAYQYLQTLPQIAQGEANKLWIVPSEFGKALEGLASLAGGGNGSGEAPPSWLSAAAGAPTRPDSGEKIDTKDWFEHKSTDIPVPPEATSTTEPGIGAPSIPDTRAVAASAVEEVKSAPPRPQPTEQLPPYPQS